MDRQLLEGVLERVVRDNRVTIAVVFPTIGALSLVSSAIGLLPAPIAFNSIVILFGVAVMRLPLVSAVMSLVDRRAAGWLALLVVYTYAIESIGIRTGWPYGEFAYTVDLGPMVGGIPLALPVFFIPLVLNAYLLAMLLARDRYVSLPLAVGLVLAMDLVLDPAAVALGFWTYPAGAFYGVPTSNFMGWILSGVVGVVAVDRAFDRTRLRDRLGSIEYALDDLVSFVLLWGIVNGFFGQWGSMLVAVAIGLALMMTDGVHLPLRTQRWVGTK